MRHAIWWHVYPLGFVGAHPPGRAGQPGPGEHRLRRIVGWLDHAVRLGANGIALGPVFASHSHGYDTTDHFRIDPRLGDDADFDHLVDEARRRGMRVQLDGVFSHVGPDHPRYLAALAGGPDSEAATWFRTKTTDDGEVRFATFEGHPGLIALNHANPAVAEHVSAVLNHWLDRGAASWRLDAAYAVPAELWARVLPPVHAAHPEAWVFGEVIHGDYAGIINQTGFDSLTQYELWKAIWSSINDRNFYELDWALRRHDDMLATFVPATFVGNHDVTRIATRITDRRHLSHVVVLLATLGGTPSIYAGDELGFRAVKEDRPGGDDAIRPAFPVSGPTALAHADRDILRLHQQLLGVRRSRPWLHSASSRTIGLGNNHLVYEVRADDSHALTIALNIADEPIRIDDATGWRRLLTHGPDEHGTAVVPAHGWAIYDSAPG